MNPENPDFREKLEPFRRRWPVIAVIALAIAALTYWHYGRQPTQYAATTQMFVRFGGSAPVVGSDPETDPGRRLLNAAAVLQSPVVAARVAEQLGYRGDPRDLLKLISVSPSADSDVISLTATTPDPRRSAAVANGFASAFAGLGVPQGKPASASGVQVIDRAVVPTTGSAASPARYALFGGILGLVLGGLVVLGLEAFDRRLRHPAVEAAYGLPLLASIPFSRKVQGATRSGQRLPVAMMERVRGLRTVLDHGGDLGVAPRTVLVTSAIPGEGKSTLVKSLALAYFESGRSVLMIDADLRRPTLHESFEAPLVPGLSDVMRSEMPLPHAVQEAQPSDLEPAFNPAPTASGMIALAGPPEPGVAPIEPTRASADGEELSGPVMHLLTSGSSTSDPAALLGGLRLKALLGEAAVTYDLVLIDSPPVLSVSDAIPLASAADAVVVIARSEFTTRDAAVRCRQALERVPNVILLGVAANAVRHDDELAPSYYFTSTTSHH